MLGFLLDIILHYFQVLTELTLLTFNIDNSTVGDCFRIFLGGAIVTGERLTLVFTGPPHYCPSWESDPMT